MLAFGAWRPLWRWASLSVLLKVCLFSSELVLTPAAIQEPWGSSETSVLGVCSKGGVDVIASTSCVVCASWSPLKKVSVTWGCSARSHRRYSVISSSHSTFTNAEVTLHREEVGSPYIRSSVLCFCFFSPLSLSLILCKLLRWLNWNADTECRCIGEAPFRMSRRKSGPGHVLGGITNGPRADTVSHSLHHVHRQLCFTFSAAPTNHQKCF